MKKIVQLTVNILIISLLGAVFIGCAVTKEPAPKYIEIEDEGSINRSASQSNAAEAAREAANLRNQVTNIDGVQDAAVVVNNTRAVIGIVPERQFRDNTGVIVDKVQSFVGRNAGGVNEVYVTAEPGLVKRIRGIERNINNGDTPDKYRGTLNNITEDINAGNNAQMQRQEGQ